MASNNTHGSSGHVIIAKQDVSLIKVDDATFCVSGIKTMFNKAYLAAHDGVYDRTEKRWVFSSYNAAHAAWAYVVEQSEKAHDKKLATPPLPAFTHKKPKSAVQLDNDEDGDDDIAAENNTKCITNRKRKSHTAHDASSGDLTGSSDDEDEPICAPTTKRARAPSTKKKQSKPADQQQHLSLTDTSGKDQYFTKPPKAPRKARTTNATLTAEKKSRKPTKKQQELANQQAAAARSFAFGLVESRGEGERAMNDNDGDNENDACDAAISVLQPNTATGAAKRFKKSTPTTVSAAKRAAAAAVAAAANAPESWELDCEIADVKEIDDAHKPAPLPIASRRRVHADLLPTTTTDEHGRDGTSSAPTRSMTREQCALLYDVGAPCDVDVTRHTEWKQPEANQTAWATTTVTKPMPCIVESTSMEDGRLCMTLHPRDPRTFVLTLDVHGYAWVVLTPDDHITFRSQKIAAVRDRNMHNCTFEVSYCTIWNSVLRDPLKRIGFALHL